MFKNNAKLGLVAFVFVASCGVPEKEPQFKSFDLDVVHPSPYSTFVSVSPGARGEKLPRVRQLNSKKFNAYLRDLTGCAVDQGRATYIIGPKKAPAGYMVPIACVN